MEKRSGTHKVGLVPRLSSYHTELQKRVAIVGVSLIIILILVGVGLYVSPGKFVGKVPTFLINFESLFVQTHSGPAPGSGEGLDTENVESDLTEGVATYTWINGDWRNPGDVTTTFCSDTSFCVSSDTYCAAAGSILPISPPHKYCAQSFQNRHYVWVTCDSSTRYELTEDSTFICDDDNGDTAGGYEWLQCTTDGEIRGNFRCDGDTWEQCGDGTAYICGGRTNALECNDDRKYTVSEDYYCSKAGSQYAWIECTRYILGEGVDNADNHERYGNNYVCARHPSGSGVSTSTNWEPITTCAACAGSLEGSCVGSSRFDLRTGEEIKRYYNIQNIDQRIGCAGVNECYFDGQEFAIDESESSGLTQICSSGNSFLRCTDGAVAIRSDGGAWLCTVDSDPDETGNGIWNRCTEDNAGVQIDNFICSYNASLQKWEWFSEFSCSQNQRYQVRDGQRICDGTSWITPTCDELETDNHFTDPMVQVTCDASGDLLVNELICNNNFDDDNDGLLDCDDPSMCSSEMGPILNGDNDYEFVIKQGDCFTANINIDEIGQPVYTQLNVCDLGTEAFGNRVTLCENRDGTNTPILTLDSTTLLANRFGQPYADANDLAFLFKEGTPKTVSVMLSRDISNPEIPLELPLATFAPNFAAGQRVMLSVDGESYLLWHPPVDATNPFGEQNLKLTHIATGTEIPAVVYPGTNRYTFDLVGDRLMTFLIDTPLADPENQIFKIEALAPGEAPQSFPIPTNLDERFEVTFSKTNPVRFIGARTELGTFSVCRDDNDADPQQVKVCRNGNLEFTLRARTLTAAQLSSPSGVSVYNTGDVIPENTAASNNVYAFLFEVVNNTKQVSIFPLQSLQRTTTPLEYDPLINAMVSGRRVAVEFENKLYLLHHPVQPFISLPSITLIRYIGDVTTTFPALGSQDLIDFLSSEGKITIQRNYGNPPPPFDISALRVQDIAPVILNVDLSTSMSSLVPVTLNNMLVRANDAQYGSDENVFKIKIGETNQLLHFQQPSRQIILQTDALYYYRSVSPSGSQLVKQVSIYRLYDLSANTQSHNYNENFRRALASGKEFAITLDEGETYYLVGYENNNNEVLSFNINRLRLFTLDKTSTIPAIPDSGGIRFDLPDGDRVRFVVNYGSGMLEMQIGLELLTEIPFTGYMTEINPSNEVQINKTANFRMCYLTAYALLPGARVCDTVGESEVDALANPLTVVPGSESYVLEVNGQTGNDKRVLVRNLTAIPISPLNYEIDDWFTFVAELVAHREPYFQVDDRLYVPQATDGRLETFRLKQYPDGAPQAPRNIRMKTPLTASGSIVMHDRVIFIEQTETTDEERPVEVSFTIPPYYYLPDNHDVIRFNSADSPSSVSFVIAVDGTEYTLSTRAPTTSVVRLSLAASQDLSNPLLDRLFAAGETRILNLDGVRVEIKVEVIAPEDGTLNAQITVKRR